MQLYLQLWRAACRTMRSGSFGQGKQHHGPCRTANVAFFVVGRLPLQRICSTVHSIKASKCMLYLDRIRQELAFETFCYATRTRSACRAYHTITRVAIYAKTHIALSEHAYFYLENSAPSLPPAKMGRASTPPLLYSYLEE